MIFTFHHSAADGASLAPFLADLSVAYSARLSGMQPQWPDLAVQYADYARWQQQLLGISQDPESLAARQLRYWRDALAGLPEELPLPRDGSRPAASLGRADRISFRLDPELRRQAARLAEEQRVSLFMVLQTGLAALLNRVGAGTDIPIGSPTEGRFDERLKDLVGYFVNTLVLRADLSGNPSFRGLLDRVRQADLAAFAHQDVPFSRVVETLNPARHAARHPLFQVALSLEHDVNSTVRLDGVEATPRAVANAMAKFDLVFEFVIGPARQGESGAIEGSLEFAVELFERSTATRIVDYFQRLLAAVLADPDKPIGLHRVIGREESENLLDRNRQRLAPARTAQSIPERFAEIVAQYPEAIALRGSDKMFNYRQLDLMSNRVANRLRVLGIEREARIAVDMARSFELIVATLAIVKAGACYIPLYSGLPGDRRRRILQDTAAALLLSDRVAAPGDPVPGLRIDLSMLLEGDDRPLVSGAEPMSLLNIFYTSGSSGEPKGIEVIHAGIVDLALDSCWQGQERVLFQSAYAFDASTYEIWVPLLRGGEVVVSPREPLTPADLRQQIAENRVTSTLLTTSLFNLLVAEDPDCFSGMHMIVTGGDAASVGAFRQVRERHPELILMNAYGPTEASVFATHYFPPPAARLRNPVPIGTSRDEMCVYVLDDGLSLCPVGVAGELYLAGRGLARGYVGQPGLTAQRFVADPHGPPGSRMYRTADLARWNIRGELEFLGRADQQVKIRGFRVELGEIETVLSEQQGVRDCAVLARGDSANGKRLVAYVVADIGYDEASTRNALAQCLPDYMVPAAFVNLERLPLTPNGKLDRKALPEPTISSHAIRAAATPREAELVRLFCDVLNLKSVGVDDSFFALGGDSILAIQLVSRARKAGLALTPAEIFNEKTPAALAAVAREVTASLAPLGRTADKSLRPGPRILAACGSGPHRCASAGSTTGRVALSRPVRPVRTGSVCRAAGAAPRRTA